MTVPDRQLLTSAFIAMLATGTGKQIGDHRAPPAPRVIPYGIVTSIPGGGFSGPGLFAPDADADFVYQVDSIGERRDQAEWLGDRVRRTILARTAGAFQVAFPAVAGLLVADREVDAIGGVDVAGDFPNEVFTVSDRYVLRVTPA